MVCIEALALHDAVINSLLATLATYISFCAVSCEVVCNAYWMAALC